MAASKTGAMQPPRVTINCDMGEGYGKWKMGPDEDLMPLIDIANIACGFHGGDPQTMHRMVKLAKQHNVRVGAHPSLPDRDGFGRRFIDISPADLFDALVYQIGALVGFLRLEQMELHHIKTHGYLYKLTQASEEHCESVIKACQLYGVPCVQAAGSRQQIMSEKMAVPFIQEFYPDCTYDDAGNLSNFVDYHDESSLKVKVEQLLRDDTVVSEQGQLVKLGISGQEVSMCIHSDQPNALRNCQQTRRIIDDYLVKSA